MIDSTLQTILHHDEVYKYILTKSIQQRTSLSNTEK